MPSFSTTKFGGLDGQGSLKKLSSASMVNPSTTARSINNDKLVGSYLKIVGG